MLAAFAEAVAATQVVVYRAVQGKGAPEAKTAKDERGWFSRNWLYVAIGVMVALNVVQIFGGGAGAAGGAAQGGAAQG